MRVTRLVSLSLLLAACAAPLYAQHAPRPDSGTPAPPRAEASPQASFDTTSSTDEKDLIVWFGAGAGLGSFADSGGVSGMTELSVRAGPHVIMTRWASMAALFTGVSDVGILYGRSTNDLAALAGIGLAYGKPNPFNSETTAVFSSTPGLALQLRWRAGTVGPLGFALEGFANVNSNSSFWGVAASLELGNF